MAPTELLMRQHYESLRASFAPLGVRVAFLSGSMTGGEKHKTLELLEKGEIDILVGTHAMIQPTVKFHKLGLVVTDEQHRFGVNQRVSLYKKGEYPDVLSYVCHTHPQDVGGSDIRGYGCLCGG